ncbi:MAG: archease [Nanoarchaeota archaeon]
MPYNLLPDTATADVAFEAKGKTLNELFESACLATSDVMADLKTVNPDITQTFTKDNEKLDALLYDVLDELVFLKDTDNTIFCQFKIDVNEGSPNKAKVTAQGQKIDQKTMALRNDVKAVTYHLFELKKTNAGYSAKVLLDV